MGSAFSFLGNLGFNRVFVLDRYRWCRSDRGCRLYCRGRGRCRARTSPYNAAHVEPPEPPLSKCGLVTDICSGSSPRGPVRMVELTPFLRRIRSFTALSSVSSAATAGTGVIGGGGGTGGGGGILGRIKDMAISIELVDPGRFATDCRPRVRYSVAACRREHCRGARLRSIARRPPRGNSSHG